MKQQETKLIEAARELLKAYGYFVDNLWHVRDIHFICEQNNITRLGDKEAMEVFEIANEQFDGETGLTWPKLEQALQIYLQRKLLMRTMSKKNDTVA